MKSYREASMATDVDTGLLIQNYKGRVRNLDWKAVNKFRITGPATADAKQLLDWRYGPEVNNFGPFIATLPVFKGGSARKTTFVSALKDPDNPGEYLDPALHPSPIVKFYEIARRVSFDSAEVKVKLFTGGTNRGPALSNPIKPYGFVQGIHLQADKLTAGRLIPRFPALMVLSPSARQALEDLLNEEKLGYTGPADNYDQRFACGNIIHPETGRIVQFRNSGLPADGSAVPEVVTWDAKQNNRTTTEVAHYVCELAPNLGPTPLPRLPDGRLSMAVDGTLFTPWDQCIRLLSEEEMIMAIAQAFEDCPDLLLKAFSDRLDLLPSSVKRRGSTSVATPPVKPVTQHSAQEPAATSSEPASVVDWGASAAQTAAPGVTAQITADAFAGAAAAAAGDDDGDIDSDETGEAEDDNEINKALKILAAAKAKAGKKSK